jgi:hypothetical protein
MYLLLLSGLGLAGGLIFYLSELGQFGLPDASEVSSMRAKLYNSPQKLPDVSEFEVPTEHISRILKALAPNQRDPRPAKWQGLGDLKLTCGNGKVIEIHLYWTGHDQGAFSVGPYGTQVYFRGGTDQGIESAIREARQASDSAKPNGS